MSFLISDALAAESQLGGGVMSFLPLVIIFVVFYFLLIRPQQKRTKVHKNMLINLSKGDEVVTSGGVLGKVKEVGENFVTVEVSNNVNLQVQKPQIAQVMPKGTVKAAG